MIEVDQGELSDRVHGDGWNLAVSHHIITKITGVGTGKVIW